MGILDDAIREHLDLKRKHGAQDAELQQLEDEAFGPPTRPGEPDFPERPPTGEHAEEMPVATEAATEEGAQPGAEEPEPLAEVPPEAAEPSGGAVFDQDVAEAPEPAIAPEPEREVEPDAIVGEPTVEHPGPLPETGEEEAMLEAPAADPEAPPEDVAPATEGGEVDVGEVELDEEFEEFRETEGSEEGAEEDVLEETPEFLRDTPENERLWFEQGEPQDFDFDDDEGDDRPA
jgi:hypothetical protein